MRNNEMGIRNWEYPSMNSFKQFIPIGVNGSTCECRVRDAAVQSTDPSGFEYL